MPDTCQRIVLAGRCLPAAPEAFIGLFAGHDSGGQLVRLT